MPTQKSHSNKHIKNVEITHPGVVSRVLSAPTRYYNKLYYFDKRVGVGDAEKQLSPETRKFIIQEALKRPDIQFYVGDSPIIDQVRRALHGKGDYPTGIIGTPYRVGASLVESLAGKITGSSYYNPASGSVIIRDDIPAMAALPLGQREDFARRHYKRLYGFFRDVPIFSLLPASRAKDYARQTTSITPEKSRIYDVYMAQHAAHALGNDPVVALGSGIVGHLLKDYHQQKDNVKNKRGK